MSRVFVELYMGSTVGWVDATGAGDVYTRDGVTISRGGSQYSQHVDPASCSLTLDNEGGKYSPRNPRSPYYGLLGRNTPCRVWVRGPETYLWVPGGTGQRGRTASSPALDVTGDLDVRIEMSLDRVPQLSASYRPQVQEIVGRYNDTGTPGNRAWLLLLDRLGQPVLGWSTDGDDYHEQFALDAPVPFVSGQRFALRATLDVDNGAGGHTVRFYTAPTLAGPWVQLGEDRVGSGITSVHAPGDASLEIGEINTINFAPAAGRYYGMELRNGIDGPLLASPDWTQFPTDGGTTTADFTDAQGNLWETVGGAKLTPFYRRFWGEVAEWPAQWHASGNDVYTPIQAAGLLRRLSQGAAPLKSTLARRIPGGGDGQPAPIAYWPMEEGEHATQAYSPLEGVTPLYTVDLNWASNDTLFGSAALPTLGKLAAMSGRVPRGSGDGWHVDLAYFLEALPANESRFFQVRLSGSKVAWFAVNLSTAGVRLEAWDKDNVLLSEFTLTDPPALSALVGKWNRMQMFTALTGSDLRLYAYWRDVVTGSSYSAHLIVPNASPGSATSVSAVWESGLQGMAIGHLGVWDVGGTANADGTDPDPGVTYFDDADDAFESETAWARVRRLAEEEDLPLVATGLDTLSQAVGPQQIAPVLENVQQAADVDGGLLIEQRETLGLAYLGRDVFYNPTPGLVLDYTARGEVMPPLAPVEDDTGLVNDVTVSRVGGSSARAVLEEGPLSTLAPPDGAGIYDTSVQVNAWADSQLPGLAHWRLHLGTVDEARYPQVTVSLMSAPHLTRDVLSLGVGSTIRLTNLPDWLPPGDVDLRIEGWTETINEFQWDITFNCSPGSPWVVGVMDADKVDTDGSELAADATDTDTSLLVHTPGTQWITAGRYITANPSFETNLDEWSPFGATEARVATPQPASFGGDWSMQITPDGVTSSPNAFTSQVPVAEGSQYIAHAWLRCATAHSLRLSINWYGASGYLSTDSTTTTVEADTWTLFEFTATAPAGATLANLSPIIVGTATTADVMLVDEAYLRIVVDGGLPGEFPFDVNVGGEHVTVSAIGPGVEDSFSRSVTGGWGTATSGSPWATSGGSASDFSVDSVAGVGHIALPTSQGTLRFAEVSDRVEGIEHVITIAVDRLPATGGAYLPGLFARGTVVDGSTVFYWLDLALLPDNTYGLEVRNGVNPVGAGVLLPGTYAPGDRTRLRMRVEGHRILGRAWPEGTTEPADWQIDRTVTTDTVDVGTFGAITASQELTTTPVFSFDDYEVVTPQGFTVARGVNGFTTSHSAGADVRLARPTIVAL